MATTSPPSKKLRPESSHDQIYTHVMQQLIVIHNSFNDKVKQLESKIDLFLVNIKNIISETFVNDNKSHCCEKVIEKLTSIERAIQKIPCKMDNDNQSLLGDVPVVLVPNYKPNLSNADGDTDSTVQVITLNTEADYPGGSWLGNDKNPEARVRVPISPSQLLHINTLCSTPEKMAVVLLDYLFTQETQAESNLSGKGKHFKKQLDPLKIYGIKTHLMHKFNITERDWYRIKQNIDSKCRTAWRKKAMGLPLTKNKGKAVFELSSEKMLKGNSIILTGPFINEENSQELLSMKVDPDDCFTLSGCCEQTLTIITDSGEVSVPILTAEDNLSVDHSSADDMLGLSS